MLAAVASIVLAAGRDEDDTAVEPSRDALASRGDAQFNGRWDGASQGASPLSSERNSPTQQHQSGDIDLESESTAAMLRSLSPPPADMLGHASGGGHSFTPGPYLSSASSHATGTFGSASDGNVNHAAIARPEAAWGA